MKVEFCKHNIDNECSLSTKEIVDTPFLATGKKVEEFEQEMEKLLGKKVVAVSSCTMALFLCLKRLKVGVGSIVITTPLSFIATSNAIEMTGARTLFVDVEYSGCINTLQIQKKIMKLEPGSLKRVKAIIPVDVYGQLCNYEGLTMKLGTKTLYDIAIIEDAAHSLSAEGVGKQADFTCFSFYATKEIASISGDGGAIACRKEEDYNKLKEMRLHGQTSSAWGRYSTGGYKHWDMVELGYKGAMSNTIAASLIPQLKKLKENKEVRKILWGRYDKAFQEEEENIQRLVLARPTSYLYYTILVDPEKRDKILEDLKAKEIGVVVNWNPIHTMTYYKKKYELGPEDFPVANKIGRSILTLPLYPRLTIEEQDYVIESVKEVVNK